MKKIVLHTKLFALLILVVWGVFSLVAGQYYYFDTTNTSYPYKQWCSTTLDIKATTEGNTIWAKAWLLRLQLDPTRFSYNTSSLAHILQTNLFVASADTFFSYSNPTVYPTWIDSNKTILHIDRYNLGSNFVGTGVYGTLKFTPTYSPIMYTGNFVIVYNGDTVRTSLSQWWNNIILEESQTQHLTWAYYVEQLPCQNDTTAPTYTLTPNGWSHHSHLDGIHILLTENSGGWSVPYIRTGWLPDIWTWTGNTRWISNQYWVNLSTFELYLSGNGNNNYFSGGMFSPSWTLTATAIDKTRQFRDKDYTLDINSSELFDYGIEKTITITGNVADWNGNTKTISTSFNHPQWPTLINGSRIPNAWASLVPVNNTLKLWIEDDWAGVNSWSIVVTLSGSNGTNYWPYSFSGNNLHLSWVTSTANQPNYYLTISEHANFPSSWTITVSVYAEDMEGNIDTINDYSFRTKPSCGDYGCFHNVFLQTGVSLPFLYNNFTLSISGGINPYFVSNENTGTLYCGTENETALNIYNGIEQNSGDAIYVNYHDLPQLTLSGNTQWVKAILSGNTLYLQKIYTLPDWGGGWWWGSNIIKDDCRLPSTLACANQEGIDYSDSYYDNTCCAVDEWTGHGSAPICTENSEDFYSEELIEAFNRAYWKNITNLCPFEDAYIPRREIAKLMSMFTIQIMGIYPDTKKESCNNYKDIHNLSSEMQFFAKTACQLNLMWLKQNGSTPKENFDPHDKITRAEFWTILSRLIYGDIYNVYSWEESQYKRYEKHLQELYADEIMTKIKNPFIQERRSRILLMLYRSERSWLAQQYRLFASAHNWALSLLETVWQ